MRLKPFIVLTLPLICLAAFGFSAKAEESVEINLDILNDLNPSETGEDQTGFRIRRFQSSEIKEEEAQKQVVVDSPPYPKRRPARQQAAWSYVSEAREDFKLSGNSVMPRVPPEPLESVSLPKDPLGKSLRTPGRKEVLKIVENLGRETGRQAPAADQILDMTNLSEAGEKADDGIDEKIEKPMVSPLFQTEFLFEYEGTSIITTEIEKNIEEKIAPLMLLKPDAKIILHVSPAVQPNDLHGRYIGLRRAVMLQKEFQKHGITPDRVIMSVRNMERQNKANRIFMTFIGR